MQTLRISALATALGLTGSFSFAGDEAQMSYALFAAKVPHITLTECPVMVAALNADCHVATIDGALHIFAFSRAGNRPLVAVHSEDGGRSADDFRLGMLN